MAQLAFGACDYRAHLRVIKWRTLFVADILHHLGQWFETMAKFGDRLVAAFNYRKHLQGGNQAITGRRVVGQNDMTGRFAADVVTVRAHVLEHISIADGRSHQLEPQAGKVTLKPES